MHYNQVHIDKIDTVGNYKLKHHFESNSQHHHISLLLVLWLGIKAKNTILKAIYNMLVECSKDVGNYKY
jgi:hypothetical protein